MAGTIDLVQRCYTGLETRNDTLWLNPLLPDELQAVHTAVGYRQHWIELEFTSTHVRIQTTPGRASPIRLGFRGEVFEMGAGETRTLDLATPG